MGKAAQAAPTQTLGKWSGQFKTWDDAETHLTQKGWSPPEDDETVPDLDTAKGRKEFIAYSKRVYEALINMDNILDKAPKDGRRGNRVIKAGYPQAQFEARAMEVVVCLWLLSGAQIKLPADEYSQKRAIDLHNDGSSLGEETDQANTEDRGLPFNKRIDEICNTLTVRCTFI